MAITPINFFMLSQLEKKEVTATHILFGYSTGYGIVFLLGILRKEDFRWSDPFSKKGRQKLH
jgi:hypothetical protein